MQPLAALLITAATTAVAQTPSPEYSVRQDQPSTGTRIRHDLTGTTQVPVNLPYSKLSEADQNKVRGWYLDLRKEDEPPYPLGGLRDILVPITKGQQLLQATGDLFILATVGPHGVATKVEVFQSPSPEMTKGVANVLFNVRFKPASCGGVPCQMVFPVKLQFAVN